MLDLTGNSNKIRLIGEILDLELFENKIKNKIFEMATNEDPAHDLLHFKRVVRTAKALCETEKASMEIVMPAAWLHDFVIVPKNDPRRKEASKLSATAALGFLNEIGYPEKYFEQIAHAIEAHSFSANIQTRTLEAKIVQDADRLDGLGAIGIARCFATAALMKRPFYSEADPFCKERAVDDSQFTVDHFYAKLFKVAENLQTTSGRWEGQKRLTVMKKYLSDLQEEV